MASNAGAGLPASSRQRLKQRLASSRGMLLVQEQEQLGVVHRTSWATRNFFSTASSLKQFATRGSRSWLIRGASSMSLDCADPGSTASSFASLSSFDLPGLIGLEDVARHVSEQGVTAIENLETRNLNIVSGGTPVASASVDTYTLNQTNQSHLDVAQISVSPHNYVQQEAADSLSLGNRSALLDVGRGEETVGFFHPIDELPVPANRLPNPIVSNHLFRVEEDLPGVTNPTVENGVTEFLNEQPLTHVQTIIEEQQKALSAAGVIQAAFRGFRTRAAIKSMHAAAVRIQSFYRGWLATKNYRMWRQHLQFQREVEERAAMRMQCCYRGWLARRSYKLGREKVVILQAMVRSRQVRKQYQQLYNAVLTLQRMWRAARKRLLQQQREVLEHAASKIQNSYRGWLARRNYRLVRDRVLLLQACVRRQHVRKQYWELYMAVLTLQRTWRASRSRRLKLQREVQDRAAVKIQSSYRGWLARKTYRLGREGVVLLQACVRRQQVRKQYGQLYSAVLTIQRTWRACRLRHLQLQRRLQEHAAVVKIQSSYRGWLASRNYRLGRAGVVLLQASVRRRQVSKRYQQLYNVVLTLQRKWRASRRRHLQLQRQVQEGAAIKIQSFYRGLQARKYYQIQRVSVVKLQAAVRRKQVRDQYRQLCNAVLTMQRMWRAARARHLQEQKDVEECATLLIQAHSWGVAVRYWLHTCQAVALTIQQAWHKQQRYRVHRLKHQVVTAVVIQAHLCDYALQHMLRRWHAAAFTIQWSWRHYRQSKAAVKIQATFRSWAIRKRNVMAAVTIQRWYRCCLRTRASLFVKQHAAVFIQSWWRGLHYQQLHRGALQARHEAAVIIQRRWRLFQLGRVERLIPEQAVVGVEAGMCTSFFRQQKQLLHVGASTDQSHLHRHQHQHVQGAAVTIQAAYRAFACRKKYQARCQEGSLIQRSWREKERMQLLGENLGLEVVTGKVVRSAGGSTVWRDVIISEFPDVPSTSGTFSSADFSKEIKYTGVREADSGGATLQHSVMELGAGEEGFFCIAGLTEDTDSLQVRFCETKEVVPTQIDNNMKGYVSLTSDLSPYADSLKKAHVRDREAENSWGPQDHVCPLKLQLVAENMGPPGTVGRLEAKESSRGIIIETKDNVTATQINGERYSLSAEAESTSAEDWNNVHIDKLDSVLDTCLAVLHPLPPVISSSSCKQPLPLDFADTAAPFFSQRAREVAGGVDNEGDVKLNLSSTSTAEKQHVCWDVYEVSAGEVYASATISQPCNDGGSPSLEAHSSPQQECFGDETGPKKQSKSLKRDQERLQQFAQVFLTMRHISNQQQHAQCAPPFPPPLLSSCSDGPNSLAAETVQCGNSHITDGFSPTNNGGHFCVHLPSPANEGEVTSVGDLLLPPRAPQVDSDIVTNSSQVPAHTGGTDVVLDMVDLLKKMKHYYDTEEHDATGSELLPGGDVEDGRAWNLQTEGSKPTLAKALGGKRLGLRDVNAVFVVLVAMVLYTRTVCRDVFFGRRQSYRKH